MFTEVKLVLKKGVVYSVILKRNRIYFRIFDPGFIHRK